MEKNGILITGLKVLAGLAVGAIVFIGMGGKKNLKKYPNPKKPESNRPVHESQEQSGVQQQQQQCTAVQQSAGEDGIVQKIKFAQELCSRAVNLIQVLVVFTEGMNSIFDNQTGVRRVNSSYNPWNQNDPDIYRYGYGLGSNRRYPHPSEVGPEGMVIRRSPNILEFVGPDDYNYPGYNNY